MSIDTYVTNFIAPNNGLNGRKALYATRFALIRSILMAGFAGGNLFAGNSQYRIFEVWARVLGNVELGNNGLFMPRTAYYHQVESSNKCAISYELAMGFTKLYAEVEMNIPFLFHVENFNGPGQGITRSPVRLQSKVRFNGEQGGVIPDLIGFKNDRTAHIFEAKGRGSPAPANRNMSCSGLQKAINQVSQVTHVNGQPPATKVACALYMGQAPFMLRVVDPISDGTGHQIRLPFHVAMKAYYSSFLSKEFLEGDVYKVDIEDSAYLLKKINDTKFHLGIKFDVLIGLHGLEQNLEGFQDSIRNTTGYAKGIEIGQDTLFFNKGSYNIGFDGVIVFEGDGPEITDVSELKI